MTTRLLERETAQRMDSAGILHAVQSMPCEECGCPWSYSVDELGMWWDAGDEISEDCADSRCECHASPVHGTRITAHVTEAA